MCMKDLFEWAEILFCFIVGFLFGKWIKIKK